jgi:DNA-binding transcriptional ArsR family regulator
MLTAAAQRGNPEPLDVRLWRVQTSNQVVTSRLKARPEGDVFRAVSDPTRRAILDRLRAGPAPVNELAADFEQSRPAISKHLRVLREARLVREERVGRERLYQLQPAPLQRVAGWVEGYRSFWQRSFEQLKSYLEEK